MPPAAFTPMFGSHGLTHERHVLDRRAARAEPGGGLHEVRAGVHRDAARAHDLLVVEVPGLEDDLHDRLAARGLRDRGTTAAMSSRTNAVLALHERGDVQDHVDFLAAERHEMHGLLGLGLGHGVAEREPADRAHLGARAGEQLRRSRARGTARRRATRSPSRALASIHVAAALKPTVGLSSVWSMEPRKRRAIDSHYCSPSPYPNRLICDASRRQSFFTFTRRSR